MVPECRANTGVCALRSAWKHTEFLAPDQMDPNKSNRKWNFESLALSQAKKQLLRFSMGWDGSGPVRTFLPEAGVLTTQPPFFSSEGFLRPCSAAPPRFPPRFLHQPGQPFERRVLRLSQEEGSTHSEAPLQPAGNRADLKRRRRRKGWGSEERGKTI